MRASTVKYPEHWIGDFTEELEIKLKIKKNCRRLKCNCDRNCVTVFSVCSVEPLVCRCFRKILLNSRILFWLRCNFISI